MRRSAFALCTIGVLGLFPGLAATPAAAQEKAFDPDSLAAVLDALTDPKATASEIGDQLSACLTPLGPKAPDHAPVIFDVTFDGAGNPEAPVLVTPPANVADRIHLRQLIRAEAAIFACTPVSTGGSPVIDVTLRFLAAGDRIEVWEDDMAAALEVEGTPVTAEAEQALSLNREDRREIQLRLRLAGVEPGGADGVFGPRTRQAIADWQRESGLPASGYLDRDQIAALETQTDEAYASQPQAAPAQPRASGPTYYRGADGCLRYPNRRIVPGQSLTCDVKGMLQGI